MNGSSFPPALDLAAKNETHFPNESAEYRSARNSLLADEIDLRRQIERVAQKRRELPPGGEVKKDYRFDTASGPVTLAELFGKHDTLIVYSYMFGPARTKPCPMCTSFMNTWDFKMKDIDQRVAFVMMARSPIARLLDDKRIRGWKHLTIVSDSEGTFTRDYVSPTDADMPGYTVFKRQNSKLFHFWSGEMGPATADPGQDPRGAPDADPLWTLLDTTPHGRGADWYPKLSYEV